MDVHGKYGKTRVRIVRVQRNGGQAGNDDLTEVNLEVLLEGEFLDAFTEGSNRKIVPTDTIKNTCYVIAKLSKFKTIEDLGIAIIRSFLKRHLHITKVIVNAEELPWERMRSNGHSEKHVFLFDKQEKHYCECTGTRGSNTYTVTSGLKDVKLMKTAGSGFEDFIVDEYTTLKPARDRLLCTKLDVNWTFGYPIPEGKFEDLFQVIRGVILETFGKRYSKSVQETMYEMITAAMSKVKSIERMQMTLPNIHHFEFDLERFNISNDKEIYYPTDDPSGLIECTVSRSPKSRL